MRRPMPKPNEIRITRYCSICNIRLTASNCRTYPTGPCDHCKARDAAEKAQRWGR